jgi:DNA-binding MarR family transcriptional regulator
VQNAIPLCGISHEFASPKGRKMTANNLTKDLRKYLYSNPMFLQYATESPFEYSVLSFLIQLSYAEGKEINPSIDTLRMGFMSRQSVVDCLDTFEARGYITRNRRYNRSNTYTVNLQKIIADITTKYAFEHRKKKYSDSQVMAITAKNNLKYPAVAHRSEYLMGNDVTCRETGELLNNEATNFKKEKREVHKVHKAEK